MVYSKDGQSPTTFMKEKLVVKILPFRREMGKEAAANVAIKINELLLKKPEINMIFAAAPSQKEFMHYLIADETIAWTRINAFHMDEYIGLPSDAPQGFGNFLKQKLFSKVPFKSINYLNGQAIRADDECVRYAKILQENPVDIVCLGIGENGHIAFNDPHVADFNDPQDVKVVDLDTVCRNQQVNEGCFAALNLVPTQAITVTIPALMHAEYMFCMVPATNKAEAVLRTLNGNISKECPATILRTKDKAILYLDKESASLLRKFKSKKIMKTKKILLVAIVLLAGLCSPLQGQIKIGIIGLDTSHSTAFTKLLNADDADKKPEYSDFRVVAAYPYGSKTIKSSYERIPEYTKEVEKHGVEIVSSIAELLEKVDCVMLETNDGNLHLEQANEVFKAGKAVFIDKPIGASLPQAIAIFQLAKKYNVPVFTSSALRFVPQNQKIRNGELGKVLGIDCFSPSKNEPSHPDFSWYGIHGVETLFTTMGTGCVSVNRMSSEGTDVVVGKWNDGRIGTFRGRRTGKALYGGTAFTSDGEVSVGGYEGYGYLLDEILKFFKTREAPVSEKETLEIFTFMEASNQSKSQGGKIISMEKTYKKGEKQAKKLIRKL